MNILLIWSIGFAISTVSLIALAVVSDKDTGETLSGVILLSIVWPLTILLFLGFYIGLKLKRFRK